MKVYVDLHVHTRYSRCSNLHPRDVAAVAQKRGLTAVAVTDHNTIEGAQAVRSLAGQLKVITAEEIRTRQGEIIGYFLRERIPPGLSVRETIAEIRRQEGLVSVPHPFDRLRSSRLEKCALEEIAGHIDMIEVFNARDIITARDEDLLGLILQQGAVPVAASDAHLKTEIGRAYVIMDDFRTPGEFLASLKCGRTVARKSPFWVHIATKIIRAGNR